MSVEVDQYLEKLDSTHIVLFHEGGKGNKRHGIWIHKKRA